MDNFNGLGVIFFEWGISLSCDTTFATHCDCYC